MSKNSFSAKSFLRISLFSVGLSVFTMSGCAVSAESPKVESAGQTSIQSKTTEKSSDSQNLTKNSSAKTKIQLKEGSPADTVRVFYKNLREKRFREAMMLTNLRAGVENLSETEMQDLSADFAPLAAQVPADFEINGEIITNNQATVTAKMPNEEAKIELKEIRLRREKDAWLILTADEKEETTAKQQGKDYFFRLRIETHHGEAQATMERIAKAQMVYAMQNKGDYADLQTLITQNLLPPDAQIDESIGYRFGIVLAAGKKNYYATAEPTAYGKSGKLSYLLESSPAGQKPRLKAEDNQGMPLKK